MNAAIIKVFASKSVYSYKRPYSLKVYRFAYAHFIKGVNNIMFTFTIVVHIANFYIILLQPFSIVHDANPTIISDSRLC